MSAKLKVGLIGVGAIGNVHGDAFTATGDAELVALCDIHAGRLRAAGDKYKVADLFDDYRELLKGPAEAVVIGVPNCRHAEMAIAALQAGKNVLLEKPAAVSSKQTARIVAAARKAKGVIQVGMVWRQAPQAQVIREYVKAGHFGKIYHIRAVMTRRRGIPGLGGWFTTKAQSGGGPMIDLGVHWFDLSMHLSGLWHPTAVSARTYAKFGPRMRNYRYVGMWAGPPNFKGVYDVEDYSAGFIRFADQATLSFEISWAGNNESDMFIELLGDKAGCRLQDGKPLVLFTEHEGHVADLSPKFPENANRFQAQAKAFIAACRREAPPAATIDEGHMVMKVIDAIYASSKANREVAIR